MMLAQRFVKLMPRKEQPLINGVIGTSLRPSAGTQTEFERGLSKLTDEMVEHVTQELRKLFSGDAASVLDSVEVRQARDMGLLHDVAREGVAMDATITQLAGTLLSKMLTRFDLLFAESAKTLTANMIDRTLTNSAQSLKTSLKDVAKSKTLDTSILTDKLKVTVQASVAESVGLIKRVPAEYLGQVQGDVMRSITSGNGLQDLIPALEKQNIKVKNWSKNVALDQTRKAYANINKGRMEALGIKKFEWVHSGGSNQPREQHMARFPAGLNGGIFSMDNLPIIDPRTGERGIPGQTYNCHCTMRPIVSFDDED